MSTNIGEVRGMQLRNMGPGLWDRMSITRFWMGQGKFGYQFTIGGEFVQLDDAEADRLIEILRQRATLGDFEEAERAQAEEEG